MVIRAGPDGIEIDNDSTRTPRVIHHHHRQFFDYSKNWHDYDYSRNKRVDNSRNNATHNYGAMPSGWDAKTPHNSQRYVPPVLPPHAHQCNASPTSRPFAAYPAPPSILPRSTAAPCDPDVPRHWSPNTHEFYPDHTTFTSPKLGTNQVKDNAAAGYDFLRICPSPKESRRRPTLDEGIVEDIQGKTMRVIERYLNKEMWGWVI
ncbi:hypothetical protein BDN72DRAFT_846097 [Pluteus cervinus]|uniref:Uncharacterized protein n=1 Tax=Pluteus cervinus TaxID=181527 RepID=A0ACD3AH57_9AGAR|nr:hypothetical protein BDN72DRAFT_846097 [Pluteus cervinus]